MKSRCRRYGRFTAATMSFGAARLRPTEVMSRFGKETHRAARNRTGLSEKDVLVAMIVLACLFGVYFLLRWNAPPETVITGQAWVIDGDTISISGTHIRLEGIDAPERDQTCLDAAGKAWPCGQTAARQLRDQVRRRELSCTPRAKDQHQRVLAVCSLPDGADLNAWMVRQGWAMASGFVKIYEDEQIEAEAQKRGIWAGRFDPPWKWRQQHRPE
jgi:endonuclease YncB( thermonuclease family)